VNLSELIIRRVVAVNQPAAGAELSLTAQGLGAWQVLGLLFTFTASAVVANRQISLALDDGTTTIWRATTANVQAAASANTYQLYPQAIATALVAGLVNLAMPPEGLLLRRGWRLRTTTALIDVGDQYSAVSMWVQELPDGPDFVVDPTMPSYAALANG
jgi:hypothetical protein